MFAEVFAALYVGHHVGDYWVQTDHQAQHKGKAGAEGVIACTKHVATYVTTQAVCTGLTVAVTNTEPHWSMVIALLVSGLFHYAADRREFGIMFKLARIIPGKWNFLMLGVPRQAYMVRKSPGESYDDNPSLGTGAWALDQSWHIATSVFLPALIVAGLS